MITKAVSEKPILNRVRKIKFEIMSTTTATTKKNPVINKTGSADILPTYTATWNTANGSNSNMTITNKSRQNTLSIIISGVPAGVNGFINGKEAELNGLHTIPPNTPTYTIVGNGDFLGVKVTVQNNTNPQNTATAYLVATNK